MNKMWGTYILFTVFVLLLIYAQILSERRIRPTLDIIQVPDGSKISVDMLLERCPIVVYDVTIGKFPNLIMRLMFPWSEKSLFSGEKTFRCTASSTCVSTKKATSVYIAHPSSPSKYVQISLDKKNALVVPKHFMLFSDDDSNVQIMERFSTVNFFCRCLSLYKT